MKISDDVTNVLANSKIESNNLFLPEGQLDRKLYVAVNKVLEALKGKWNRKTKSHVFNVSPVDIIDEILLTGEYVDEKKEFQFFETPSDLAKQLVEMADIQPGESILEPSAGKGKIAELIKSCNCVELNQANREYLLKRGFKLVGEDFLKFDGSYDVIIANPPFSKQQDIDHVNRMIDIAKRRVVSVMSSSVMFRDNKKTVLFRERIKSLGGSIELLPEKIFAESGTNVRACIIVVDV